MAELKHTHASLSGALWSLGVTTYTSLGDTTIFDVGPSCCRLHNSPAEHNYIGPDPPSPEVERIASVEVTMPQCLATFESYADLAHPSVRPRSTYT
jgi:hypothetical protein